MMWRPMDPGHPAYNAATDAPFRSVVEDLYIGLDGIVGETMKRLNGNDLLVVMSDHGFASWRRTFNLNTWLRDAGYLAVREGAPRTNARVLRQCGLVPDTRVRARAERFVHQPERTRGKRCRRTGGSGCASLRKLGRSSRL